MKLLKLTFTALAFMLLLATTFQFHYRSDSSYKTERFLLAEQNSLAEHEMFVTVLLKTEDFRLIFNSFFFKAALEQSLKDFINGITSCDDGRKGNTQSTNSTTFSSFDLDPNNPSHNGVLGAVEHDIDYCKPDVNGENNFKCYVVVKARCRGQRTECKKRVNKKFQDTAQKSVCEFGINDLLKEKITSSSIFSYNVMESVRNFTFDFQKTSDTSLSDIDDVKATNNIAEVNVPTCPQCELQPDILREFYNVLGKEFHYEGHECNHVGINCDHEKKATQIWLNDKKISSNLTFSRIHVLKSLRGLFLENNEIEGTIPDMSKLVKRLELLESLRLENNKLEGSIPSELGDLAGLREFIASDNQLSNEIPLNLLYNSKLKTLDLGNNLLNGTIPISIMIPEPEKGCVPDFFAKLRSRICRKKHAEASKSSLETLSLYNNRLNGQIPSSLFELPKLSILNLANNSLAGTLPTEIGLAKALKVLDIRNDVEGSNFVGGEIPSEIGEASRLEIINLYRNDLRGTIPSESMELKELSKLVLDRNEFTGPLPDFHEDNKLKIISLGRNDISSTIPTSISYLQKTTVLNLELNELSGSIPSEIGKMNSLEYLIFSFNNLSGVMPSELGNLSNLKRLLLWNNNLSGALPRELGNLISLEGIDLDQNDLIGSIPTELGRLTKVEVMWLFDNQLTGSIPSELGLLTNLNLIDFGGNNLSGSVPSELFALPSVYILVGGNPDLYALCDQYYNSSMIDIDCNESRGVPSAAPSISLRPTSSSPPTISFIPSLIPTSSFAPSNNPSISPSLIPSTFPSVSLMPTSSSAPASGIECSCEPGQFKFELELKTDRWPTETSWKIEDGNEDILASESGYNEQFTTFNYEYCLPVGCYDFIIDDSAWEGICCDAGDGYYKGSVYGWKEVFHGGDFEDQAIEHFCGEDVCPFASHYPSTSPSTSSRPSISSQPSPLPSASPQPSMADDDDYDYDEDYYINSIDDGDFNFNDYFDVDDDW